MNEFLNSAFSLAGQVVQLFILMTVGFICSKTKLISGKGVKEFVNILLYIVTPCLIVNSFLSVEFNNETINSLLIATGCAIVSHIIGIIVSFVVNDSNEKKKSVLRFGTIFSNAGYMGLPLAQAVFGAEGVFYASIYVVMFNVIQWTYGISLYDKGKNSLLKVLINPGTIGVIIGLPLFLLKVSLPDIIFTPINYLSSLNTPLAMMITGYYFTCSKLNVGMNNFKMWLVVILRLIAVPLISLVIFKYLFKIDGVLLCCCILPVSAPTAVNTMVLASKFESDTDLGLKLITITTLLSIITMPVILALAQI